MGLTPYNKPLIITKKSVLAGFIYMVLYGILMANTREDWVTPLKPGQLNRP